MNSQQQRMKLVRQISNNLGLLTLDNTTKLFKPIKLAYQPFLCKEQVKKIMQQSHLIWQKLVVKASKNKDLINKLFAGQLSDQDIMIKNWVQIYNKAVEKQLNFKTFDFCRTDYFVDQNSGLPKIIQYNFQATSMLSHSQKYHYAQHLASFQLQNENKINLPEQQKTLKNEPLQLFVNTLSKYYKQQQLKGIVLIVVQPNQTNVFEINSVVLQLIKRGIKVKKDTFEEINKVSKVNQENILFYKQDQVSVVYYRTGYRPQDYQTQKRGNQCWEAKRKMELSTSLKIPSVATDLANQKRMQVQLSKKQVYSQYLQPLQCQIIEKTLVKNFDFDDQKHHEEIFAQIKNKGIQNFLAKPNRQGGGNNVFGEEAFKMLENLKPKCRKNYIVMQMIKPECRKNIFLGNSIIQQCQVVSQISQYGLIISKYQQIEKNKAEGYLVRTKPAQQKEGGIMCGAAGLGYMKIV